MGAQVAMYPRPKSQTNLTNLKCQDLQILQGQLRADHPKTNNGKIMIWKLDFGSMGFLLELHHESHLRLGRSCVVMSRGKAYLSIFQLQAILELSESGPDVLALVGPSLLHNRCLSLDPRGKAMANNGMGT